jgi:hypothetical protein
MTRSSVDGCSDAGSTLYRFLQVLFYAQHFDVDDDSCVAVRIQHT